MPVTTLLRVTLGAVVLACTLAAPIARAGDGRIEINQTCATTSGCSGDAPGFPVTTVASTSYVMTSNLVVPDANTTAVQLAAGSTLDMAGFSITGPTTCTGAPAACSGSGSGVGIVASAGATIRNGRVAGMGNHGIQISSGVRVERVAVIANGSRGINSDGAATQIVECRLQQNAGSGIYMPHVGVAASLVLRNAVWGNGVEGIAAVGALILDNAVGSNGSYGVNTGFANGDAAWGRNYLDNNNGGNANAQAAGVQLGTNICGTAVCP